MKKSLVFSVFFAILLFSLVGVSAAACSIDTVLLNQDPYPAVPGEYVKLVFQVKGIENPECGIIGFDLAEEYPLEFDPGINSTISVASGTFISQEFKTYLLAPYKVRVDRQALDGENLIKTRVLRSGGRFNYTENFNLTVEDLRTDFEVNVRSYDPATGDITFEILNVGEHDVEALTVDIPEQTGFKIKGNSRSIVGTLDQNEDTTFSFSGTPTGNSITLEISYNDQINERRRSTEEVSINLGNFEGNGNGDGFSAWFWLFWILVVALVVWWYLRRRKHKKMKK